jgi:hypothetical protein
MESFSYSCSFSFSAAGPGKKKKNKITKKRDACGFAGVGIAARIAALHHGGVPSQSVPFAFAFIITFFREGDGDE